MDKLGPVSDYMSRMEEQQRLQIEAYRQLYQPPSFYNCSFGLSLPEKADPSPNLKLLLLEDEI